MTIEIPPWLGSAILLGVCGLAFLKGGVEERVTAVTLFIATWGTILLRDRSWPQVQATAFALDVAVLAVLLVIALRTAKYWPLAAAGFQLLGVVTHIGKLIDPHVNQWAYITAGVIWTYLLIIALSVGAWNTWRARVRPAKDERDRRLGETPP